MIRLLPVLLPKIAKKRIMIRFLIINRYAADRFHIHMLFTIVHHNVKLMSCMLHRRLKCLRVDVTVMFYAIRAFNSVNFCDLPTVENILKITWNLKVKRLTFTKHKDCGLVISSNLKTFWLVVSFLQHVESWTFLIIILCLKREDCCMCVFFF